MTDVWRWQSPYLLHEYLSKTLVIPSTQAKALGPILPLPSMNCAVGQTEMAKSLASI